MFKRLTERLFEKRMKNVLNYMTQRSKLLEKLIKMAVVAETQFFYYLDILLFIIRTW